MMLSSTSIQVTVLPLPSQFIHGILKGYLVRYGRADEPLSPGNIRLLQWNQLVVNLTNLEEFTNYSVQASGVSSKGQGPFSSPLYVQTDEDGNLLLIYHLTVGYICRYRSPLKKSADIVKKRGKILIEYGENCSAPSTGQRTLKSVSWACLGETFDSITVLTSEP